MRSHTVLTIAGLVAAANRIEAQSPPKRTLVPAMSITSTPAKAQFDRAIARRLTVPAGFHIDLFASGLGGPRILTVGDDGTVYVTRRDSDDVIALRDNGTGTAGPARVVVRNLPGVHGIALHDGKMYLATVKEVWVADMHADGTVGMPRAIVADLPDGGQHPNRTLAFGPDGYLYVSVGSTCNLCNEPNEENATILRMTADGTERGVFARGLRNTIGWGWHPTTKEMWGMDHGSDSKGNDIPVEELNKLQSATNYGWPNCYGDRTVDNFYSNQPAGTTKEELCPRTTAPVLGFQAHSAPIQMAFYTGTMFPADYRGDAFVAMRGSWNREPPSGYKLVRIHFQNGQPVRFDDFVTGFISADHNTYYGRLAGVTMMRDGSLLLGDDTNGAIYRITYGTATQRAASADRTAMTSGGDVALGGKMDTTGVASQHDTTMPPAAPKANANRIAFVDSLKEPESALYDADQDVYFVSNIDGTSAGKDGRAFVSRIAAGRAGAGGAKTIRWIQSGRNGVTLNAPKGMAIVGDTLWVADIDAMRAFNRKTGAPIASIDLAAQGAAFLNDVVVGDDGNVYTTDTEIVYDAKGNTTHPRTDRVFKIDARRAVTTPLQTDRLSRPNGIVWDGSARRFVIVPFGGDSLFSWTPGQNALQFVATGPGQFDGVVMASGTLLVSSKATSTIYALRGGKLVPAIQHVPDVADIGVDTRRGLLLVPLTASNHLEIYKSP
ncbi:MAG TPA: PQQ-dependent sugar dehydrogenase [Gemmatimonadaceae bacterium]